ncbi:VUT family protein [uncultured Roseobacter sp.]|uniref:VUT family protein n=1 Tax=uncultured Roseobacter sp. TaxID=114847 RepID=UPI00261BC749|nr:VUT family protein [uncultured Roseobacter sp.]
MLAGFAACVPLANWLIENVGVTCVPDGPCLVPVAPGLDAPSGVLVIGIALVLRDFVQRYLGIRWAMVAIGIGAVLSLLTASPGLVLASVVAFVVSETIDLAVYTPIVKRSLAWAVLASGVAGSVADSFVFVWLAFGTLDYVPGQVVGKLWASLLGFAALAAIRGRAQAFASRS